MGAYDGAAPQRTARTARAGIAARETSQTLDRGLRLLELLADSPGGSSVSELAGRLGVGRAVVYRLLATLEDHALVQRDPSGTVRPGFGLLPLARAVEPALRDDALPILRRLAHDAGATAHLSVVDAGEALAVAVVEPGWTDYHVAYRVGSRHPLERGAAGRAILAARSGSDSWVTSSGELARGAYGVAAPVVCASGARVPELEASIGVVALAQLDAEVVGPRVVAAAAELAALLLPVIPSRDAP